MLDLCAGIGGISLGAHMAGIETAAFCEIEPFCQKVLNQHWPEVPVFDDIRTLDKEKLERAGVIGNGRTIDIISGGYPCQPFSYAGQRRGEEDDRHLWPEFKRIIQEIRPRWFIGENVAGHVTLGLDNVLIDLESIDYTAQTFVIPACSVGAPHRRDRVFIVAYTDRFGCVEYKGQQEEIQQTRDEGLQREENEQSNVPESVYSVENVRTITDTNSKSEPQADQTACTERSERNAWDDLARWVGPNVSRTYWEANQPGVCGVDDGIPDRVDRVKALGNAVVPQQIYPIFKAIMDIESK